MEMSATENASAQRRTEPTATKARDPLSGRDHLVSRKESSGRKEVHPDIQTLKDIQEGSKRVIRERQKQQQAGASPAQAKSGPANSSLSSDKSYHSSPYRESFGDGQKRMLEAKVEELARKLEEAKRTASMSEEESRERLAKLLEENRRLATQMEDVRVQRRANSQELGRVRDETDSTVQTLSDKVKGHQEVIQGLQSQVGTKS